MPLAPATGTGDPDALGGYLVSGRLGEGNQGVVYAADTPDGDAVAIKLLHPRFRLADERAERFLAALEPLVEAEHPHVPTLLDAGIHDGRPYVVHQRAHGFPLLANVSGTGLVDVVRGTARALESLHAAGIVHGHVKPGNILLGGDGPWLLDGGLVGALQAATVFSALVSTPEYISPEQVAGEEIGPPADVFAWASTVVFAATGHTPFSGDSVSEVLDRVFAGSPDLSGVPTRLRPLLIRCLAKQPEERPTMSEVVEVVAPPVKVAVLRAGAGAAADAASDVSATAGSSTGGEEGEASSASGSVVESEEAEDAVRGEVPGDGAGSGDEGEVAEDAGAVSGDAVDAENRTEEEPDIASEAETSEAETAEDTAVRDPESDGEPDRETGSPTDADLADLDVHTSEPEIASGAGADGEPPSGAETGSDPVAEPETGSEEGDGREREHAPAPERPATAEKASDRAEEPAQAEKSDEPEEDDDHGWSAPVPVGTVPAGTGASRRGKPAKRMLLGAGVAAVVAVPLWLTFGGGAELIARPRPVATAGIVNVDVTSPDATASPAPGIEDTAATAAPSPAQDTEDAANTATPSPGGTESETRRDDAVTWLGYGYRVRSLKLEAKVLSLAASEVDGRAVVVAGDADGAVRVWDTLTGDAVGEPLTGHRGAVRAVVTGTLGDRPIAVSGGEDGTVRVWNLKTGRAIGRPYKIRKEVSALAVVPGKRPLLAVATRDRVIRVFDLRSRKRVGRAMRGHTGAITALATAELKNRPVLLSAGRDKRIRVWDPVRGRPVGKPYRGHKRPVAALTTGMLNGRPVVVSAGAERPVRVWRLSDRATGRRPFTGPKRTIRALSGTTLAGRHTLVAGGEDGVLRAWDLATGKLRGKIEEAHDGSAVAVVPHVDSGGRLMIVSAGSDATVRIWRFGSLN